MARTPTDMDGFLPLLTTADTKAKLTTGAKLYDYLCKVLPSPGEGEPSIECSDIGLFIDSLLPWITSSNYKVSLQGLEIMIELCDKMQADFKPYVTGILQAIIDRLGDSKETIREKSHFFLMKLMETESINVQYLFDRLASTGFQHKNSNVREQCLKLLDATLVTYGTRALTISKLVPFIVKLLSDPHSAVRDAAFNSLVVIYKFVGDRLRIDLTKKYPVPANKLAPLLSKFEDIKLSGELEPSAAMTESIFEDEVDRARVNSLKRSTLQSVNRKMTSKLGGSTEEITSSLGRMALSRSNSVRKPLSSAGSSDAGGVSEDYFERAFDDVPSVQVYGNRDVEDHFIKIRNVIGDSTQEWNKRVDALKKIRSLVMAAPNYEDLATIVRTLEQPMETCVKDLRSQVVREACITIAYLSRYLGSKFDHFAEYILTSLIQLIPNSAKVISTASYLAIRFILTHTHYPRLIPVISRSLTSKSKDIRRGCCEFTELMLKTWQTHSLERQTSHLQELIKKGIADADPEARVYARKAYWSYIEHFPEHGESLLNSLDPSHKRALMSNSSSTNSLSRVDGVARVDTGLTRTIDRRYNTPLNSSMCANKPVIQPRSSSAIDLQAAQRAKVRAQYAALARQKVAIGPTPRSRKNSITELTPDRERAGRTRSRVSVSTPTSRSSSPSSRLAYQSYSPATTHSMRRRGSSAIPRSTDTSRESSPNRYKYRASSLSGGRPPLQPTRPGIMAQKILQQSREAESALADAFDSPEISRGTTRKSFRSLIDDHGSDESETSSLCSEISYDSSFRRTSDAYSSWNGSQNRIYRDICESTPKDIGEIITNCESTHWNDRKDGLVNLHCYLQAGNLLSPPDLKRITDIFTKMFMDSHTKVFSLFLDCFNALVISHHHELHSWLYILITRLLNKQGADLLGSVHTKILHSLDVVKDSFPPHLQLQAVFRFLSDPTQTPNSKVKLAALVFIQKLAGVTDPSLAFPLPSQGGKDFATTALSKMIGWTICENIKQGQGGDLRRTAQETILALFNLNTPQITFRFSLLPAEYQEAAATLIKTRVRKSSVSSQHETGNGFSSLPASPRLGSPHGSGPYAGLDRPGAAGYHSLENAENLNSEEIYKSLRRTTAEIVKLSGDSERGDSVSYDSGISQMSAPGIEDNGLHLRERTDNNMQDLPSLQKLLEGLKDSEKKPVSERKRLCSKLQETVQADTNSISVQFKGVLYQLLSLSEDEEPAIREYAITILNSMVKKPQIYPLFINYIELVVLKVINRSKDANKDVYKACEACALSLAVSLPPEKVTRILYPLIVAEEHPVNLVAIKMLTKVIEVNGRQSVEPFLPNIMPALLQAYENEDSCVRKCSVFCMVALYKELGEAGLSPYINKLSGAKLKLLQLYIKRSQNHSASSVPTSPKSNM